MKKLSLSFLWIFFCATFSFAQDDAILDSMEVYFKLDKAVLKAESKASIDSAISKYKERILKLRVTGHTCDLGGNNYNMGLSERRAQAAHEYVTSTYTDIAEKTELFFYGEKEQRYDERDLNRRVHVLLYLEDDDRDTLIQNNCAEAFIEKGTYKPAKNKNIAFSLNYFDTKQKVQSNNISIEDNTGRKLLFNSIAYYSAKVDGNEATANKAIKIKLPLVKENKAGFTLYRGEDNGGKIVWKNTGKPCEVTAGCEKGTYNFDLQGSGYCACAQPRACEEDCNDDPFGGLENPNLKAANIKYSAEQTVAEFANGTYADLAGVSVIDDNKLEEDLDLCTQFKYGLTTKDWFPAYDNVNGKVKKNIIIKSSAKPNGGKTTRLYVAKDKVADMKAPILLKGATTSKGYMKWGKEAIKPTTCLGTVNCDFYVFDVPASTGYKLAEWSDKKVEQAPASYTLKIRLLKGCEVFVGNKKTGYVYKAKNVNRSGKVRTKEFEIRDFENASDIVVLARNNTKKTPRYQEVNLTDLKFKKKKSGKIYIMRRLKFKKIDNFENIPLSKCK